MNTTVTLTIFSQDVVHSWWVPKLGGKVDATPGHDAETWFRADEEGTYDGVCAELCGLGHATMRARARVVTEEEFDAWIEEQNA